ncbi:hypothetical protein ACGE0T_18765 [Parabacteroides sp. APC149_11_2_Y6]
MKNLLLSICICSLFFSCQKEIIESNKNELKENFNLEKENNQAFTDTSFVSFIYKGVKYDSNIQWEDNKEGVFLNAETQSIVNKIKSNPNLVTFVHLDKSIEYFDNTKELEDYLHSQQPKTKSQRLCTYEGVLTLYQDPKCRGAELSLKLNSNCGRIDYPQMPIDPMVLTNPQNWNRSISSFDLNSTIIESPTGLGHGDRCVVEFFSEYNFAGYAIWFAIDPYNPHGYIHYLSSYKKYPGSKDNWDDLICSCRFFFAY